MVIKDIAKIEFDPDNGELWVSSHHIFKPKKQKIVGTVSIIFVQPEDDISSSSEVQDNTIEDSKSKDVDFCASVNRNQVLKEATTRINSPIQLEIPASLSVIPVPFGGSNGMSWNGTSVSPFNGNTNRSNVSNKSNAKNLDINESYFEKSDIHNIDESLTDTTEKERKLSEDRQQKEHNVSVIDLSGEKCDSEYRSVYPSQDCRNLSQSNNYVPNEKKVKSSLQDTGDGNCPNVETGRKHPNQYLKNIRAHRQRNPNIRDAIRYSNSSHKSVCYICGENLDSFEKMLDHCSVHKLSKECPVCGVKFSATCNLKRHCMGHVSKTAFSCPVCPALYRRKDNLHVHMQKHNIFKYGMRNSYTKFSNLKRQIHSPGSGSWPRISRPPFSVKRPITDGKISTSKNESASVSSFDSRYGSYDEMEIETDSSNINADVSGHNANPQNTGEELNEASIQKDIKQEMDSFTGFVSVEGDTMILHKGREDGKLEKMKKESIINYSCSTCHMKFENLENVKKHAILYHGEKLPEAAGDVHLSPELQHYIQGECSSTINPGGSNVITESAKSMESSLEEGLIFSDAQQFSASFTSISSGCEVPDITCPEIQTTAAAPAAVDDDYGSCITSVNYTTGTTADTLAQSLSHMHSSSPSQNMNRNKSESKIPNHFKMKFKLKPPSNLAGSPSLSNRRTGIGSRLPVCKFCGQYLDTWEMIIEHLRHHQDILGDKYACVVCATKFSSKDCLRRHAVNHMGIRFQCNICSNAYSRKDNLQKHMKDAHGQYSAHGYPVKLDH